MTKKKRIYTYTVCQFYVARMLHHKKQDFRDVQYKIVLECLSVGEDLPAES